MDIGKILLVYLCMAIAVSFFFPQVVISPDKQVSVLGIFDVYVNSTTGTIAMGNSDRFNDDSLNDAIPNDGKTNSGIFATIGNYASSFFQFVVDGLKNVLGFIAMMGKFLFSPILFVADPNLLGGPPIYIKMIFALPLILMGAIALVRFIAGRF